MTDGPDWYSDDRTQTDPESAPERADSGTQASDGDSLESARRPDQGGRPDRSDGLGEPATTSTVVAGERGWRDNGEVPIDEYTTDRRSLASLVQVQWAISAALAALILGFVVTAGLQVLDVPPRLGALSILLFLVLAAVWVALRYRVWVYQIRDDAIYLERGVVTHVRTLVPYVRIQHVDTSRGPVERALGLSTLVVYTAGSRGADVSIPGLRPHEASDLQQRIKELAIEAEGDDAV